LYTKSVGDRGLCASCRRLLAGDVPWKPDTGNAAEPDGEETSRPGVVGKIARPRRRTSGPALRRIAIGALAAAVVGGAGAAVAFRRKALSDGWTSIERHIPSNAWGSFRRRTSHAWTTVRHEASEAWTAVSRRVPFLASKADSATAAKPAAERDDAVARGTPRRKTASRTKRGRDD
jgi:hypothetical protein